MASRGSGRALEGVFSNGAAAGGGSPLGLLVDAANAQHTNQAEQQRQQEEQQGQLAAALAAGGASEAQYLAAAEGMHHQQGLAGNMELQEALQREALERRAAMMGFGGSGLGASGGLPPGLATQQEAEYLQQLRLEALVQQRRQETLAQLALAQESGMGGGDIQALMQAQQLRQAALMRQDLLGVTGLPPGYEQLGLGGIGAQEEENLYLQQLLEERERQVKLAALASASGINMAELAGQHGFGSLAGAQGMAGLAGLVDSSRPDGIGSHHAAMEQAHHHHHQQQQQQQQTALMSREAEAAGAMGMTLPPQIAQLQAVDGSKTTVLPCRARGMPMDHNVKTAYFVINEDIKHGTELVCSYFACRNAGIKFRYCTYCKLPVAKRNFCKRHKHTGKIPPDQVVKDLDMSIDGDDSSEGSASETMRKSPAPPVSFNATPSKKVSDKKPKKSPKKTRKKRTLKIKAEDAMGALVKDEVDELDPNDSLKDSLTDEQAIDFSDRRLEKWNELMNKRPRYDRDAMLFWVQDVLAMSDYDMPLDGEEPASKKQKTETGAVIADTLKAREQATSESAAESTEKVDGAPMEVDGPKAKETVDMPEKKESSEKKASAKAAVEAKSVVKDKSTAKKDEKITDEKENTSCSDRAEALQDKVETDKEDEATDTKSPKEDEKANDSTPMKEDNAKITPPSDKKGQDDGDDKTATTKDAVMQDVASASEDESGADGKDEVGKFSVVDRPKVKKGGKMKALVARKDLDDSDRETKKIGKKALAARKELEEDVEQKKEEVGKESGDKKTVQSEVESEKKENDKASVDKTEEGVKNTEKVKTETDLKDEAKAEKKDETDVKEAVENGKKDDDGKDSKEKVETNTDDVKKEENDKPTDEKADDEDKDDYSASSDDNDKVVSDDNSEQSDDSVDLRASRRK